MRLEEEKEKLKKVQKSYLQELNYCQLHHQKYSNPTF